MLVALCCFRLFLQRGKTTPVTKSTYLLLLLATADPEVISKALELGYRHFDCAAFYGNQCVIGDALKPWIAAAHGRRQELFITSKIWNTEHRPEAARWVLGGGGGWVCRKGL